MRGLGNSQCEYPRECVYCKVTPINDYNFDEHVESVARATYYLAQFCHRTYPINMLASYFVQFPRLHTPANAYVYVLAHMQRA